MTLAIEDIKKIKDEIAEKDVPFMWCCTATVRTLCDMAEDAEKLEAENARLKAENERWRQVSIDSLSSLVASVSLLERGGKKAAPSNKMFFKMLGDYKAAIKRCRAALGKKRMTNEPKQDADGWIEWSGGDCPLPPDDGYSSYAEIEFECGERVVDYVRNLDGEWRCNDSRYNVKRYRLLAPVKPLTISKEGMERASDIMHKTSMGRLKHKNTDEFMAAEDSLDINYLPENRERDEYGSVEGALIDVGTNYNQPSVTILERKSGRKIVCRIEQNVINQIANSASFRDVWDHKRVRVRGLISFDARGQISRVYAKSIINISPRTMTLRDIEDRNFTQNMNNLEYLDKLREGDLGH